MVRCNGDLNMALDMDEFWVFGYGSLMWNPGFAFVEKADAVVFGYRRSLCVSSWVHRGSETSPGLVLGLDRKAFDHQHHHRVKPIEQQVSQHRQNHQRQNGKTSKRRDVAPGFL